MEEACPKEVEEASRGEGSSWLALGPQEGGGFGLDCGKTPETHEAV